MEWFKTTPPDVLEYIKRKNKPEWVNRPSPRNWVMWQAFHHLQGSRGFSGSIPFSEITNYCNELGMTCPVQRWRLAYVVIALDNAGNSNGTRSSDGPARDHDGIGAG